MRQAFVTRNRVVQDYVDRAQEAERHRLEAQGRGCHLDAEVYGLVATYCWCQATYGGAHDDGNNLDDHAWDAAFLVAVTGDSEAVTQGAWSSFHASILVSALSILTAKELEVALQHFVAGFTLEEIAINQDLRYKITWAPKTATVAKVLQGVRSKWAELLGRVHSDESDEPADLIGYRDESNRLAERILASFDHRAYLTSEVARRVGGDNSRVSNTLLRLAVEGRIDSVKVGSRFLWASFESGMDVVSDVAPIAC